MYSCKKATEIIEKKSVIGLSFIESLNLKLHLSMCKACSNYKKQSKLIDYFFEKENEENIELIENKELQTSIRSKLEQNPSEDSI
jgi:hypothetical protein